MSNSTAGFYVTAFLDRLHERVARYGERALRVQVDPAGRLDDADIDILR